MNRPMLAALALAGLMLAAPGCKKQAATPAAPKAAATTPAKTAAKKAPAAKPVPAAKATAKPPTPAKPAAAAKGGTVAAAAATKGGADAGATENQKPRDPSLTMAECKKACAHAEKLSLANLPKNAKPELKAALKKALTERCPKACLMKGTKASVECVINAKTAMDLGNCPK